MARYDSTEEFSEATELSYERAASAVRHVTGNEGPLSGHVIKDDVDEPDWWVHVLDDDGPIAAVRLSGKYAWVYLINGRTEFFEEGQDD